MLARAAVLPFLAVAIAAAATGGAAQRPAEKNYTCQAGQCVQSARGLPYKECELACAPPPGNFTCQSGKCVKSARGLPLAECSKICEAPGPGGKTIVDIALATPDLSTLVTALKAGGLVDTLSNQGPFTVFAPKNEAFAALPAGVVAKLLKPENKRQLDDVLTFHVVAGAVHAKDLRDGEKLKTLEGKELTVRLAGSTVFINSAKVTTADVSASNGVIHIIDEVLLPAGPAPPPGPPGPPPPPPPGPPGPSSCTGASVSLAADQCAAWGEFWDGAGGPNWGGKGQDCSRSDPCGTCRHGVGCGPKMASSNCSLSDSCDSSITEM
jgi:uncharacterized surface protein with fasciclin (FAS1) repeats